MIAAFDIKKITADYGDRFFSHMWEGSEIVQTVLCDILIPRYFYIGQYAVVTEETEFIIKYHYQLYYGIECI